MEEAHGGEEGEVDNRAEGWVEKERQQQPQQLQQ